MKTLLESRKLKIENALISAESEYQAAINKAKELEINIFRMQGAKLEIDELLKSFTSQETQNNLNIDSVPFKEAPVGASDEGAVMNN